MISRRVAALAFPGISPIGQRLQAGGDEVEVVGVASDVALTPEGDVAPAIYHDHAQFAANRNWALIQVVATGMEDPARPIRAALGARRTALSRLVLRHGLALVGAGAALGLLGAVVLGRVLSALVFESAPTDPGVLAGAVATLATAALLALWLPVRRATSVEPRQALEAE